MNCNEAVAALIASLERGEAMTAEQREHIRTCPRCHALLDSAKQFQTLLGENGVKMPAVDATLRKAEEEVLRQRQRRIVKTIIGMVLLIVGGVALMMLQRGQDFDLRTILTFLVAGTFLASFAAAPIVILIRLNREWKKRFFKRLKPGRQISGVCLGIAETTGVSVTTVRLVFLFLLFFKGLGLLLYVLLDLAMPVHPDDRQHLLRFKLRRWLEKRRIAHAHDDAR